MTRSASRPGRRVAVVTGTRAEYGPLKSVMQALSRKKGVKLQVVVTGMHLLRRFGHTIEDVRADGWRIDATVPMQAGNDDPKDQAYGLAKGIKGMAEFLVKARTDIVVVLGDRIEALAGALAGTTTGRIVAHIHGGDVAPGDLDEPIRHSITKLAHIHLAATEDAARRIRRLGEQDTSVHVVGAPGLDRLVELLSQPGIKPKATNRALVVQHASGRPAEREKRVMRAILRAVRDNGLLPTVVYPNSDRGHSGIVHAIQEALPGVKRSGMVVHRSLPRDEYLRTLIEARVLVGNSSSGIMEAATAGTAVVNVGSRQSGRLRAGPSIVDAEESYTSISTSLQKALRLRPRPGRPTPYGVGKAARAIADILGRANTSESARRKRIAY